MKPLQIGSEPVRNSNIIRSFPEFARLYKHRPIVDNYLGMKSCHMFALWYMLRHLKPKVIVESGVAKGQSTWLIEQVCPNAQLYCIDIVLHNLVYKSKKATYYNKDFSTYNWRRLPKRDTLLFFDDHQNAYERLKTLKWYGFQHAIFDDNYTSGSGDCYSLKKVLQNAGNDPPIVYPKKRIKRLKTKIKEYLFGRDLSTKKVYPNSIDSVYLKKNVKIYYEFPPLSMFEKTMWGGYWKNDIDRTKAPLFNKNYIHQFPNIYEEAKWYAWICYIRLK